MHNRSTPADLPDECLEAQRAAKKAGKIRFAGVSTHYNMDQMMAYLVKLGQTDVILTTYNFAMKNVALDGQAARVVDMGAAIQATRKAGIGIVVMKALAGGPSRAARGDRLYGSTPEGVTKALGRPGGPVAAIRWVLNNQSVDTTIVCMTDQDQLEENMLAMAAPFSPSDEKLLSQQLASISPYYCRMCGSCNGVCDKGVPVPDMLRYVSYADGYGQFAMAREKFMEHSAEVRAIRCEDGGSCSVDCPYGVQVRDQVMRAQDLFA